MADCSVIIYSFKYTDELGECICYESSDSLFKLVNNAMNVLYGLDVFDGYTHTTLTMAFRVIKYYSNQLETASFKREINKLIQQLNRELYYLDLFLSTQVQIDYMNNILYKSLMYTKERMKIILYD